jgi:signal peptidase I
MIKTIQKKAIKIIFQIIFLICCSIFLYLRPFYIVTVVGASMEPTYKSGQILLANAYDKNYQLKDVVVAEQEMENIVKRIAYMPGQKFLCADLTFRKYTPIPKLKNLKKQIEYLNAHGIKCEIYTVPEDHYFLIGDNDAQSEDSRNFGPIHKSKIKAKIIN